MAKRDFDESKRAFGEKCMALSAGVIAIPDSAVMDCNVIKELPKGESWLNVSRKRLPGYYVSHMPDECVLKKENKPV
jgi:hypothetical protein